MGGLDDAKRKVRKLLRLGAAGLLLSNTPSNAGPGELTDSPFPPREFHHIDQLRHGLQRMPLRHRNTALMIFGMVTIILSIRSLLQAKRKLC